ncbi:hypothetical protein KM043_009650 [Ampulex compressa]|nr:hypothetical protein KM043_009650 [Ampulex compressa]
MDTKETDGNLSTQKVLSPSHDPGWNDPPKWAYSPTPGVSATPTKRLLNKRVAFPLNFQETVDKQSTSETNSNLINMPPPLQSSVQLTTAPHRPLVSLASQEAETQEREIEIDKNQMLHDALKNLIIVINDNITEKSMADEIKRRLDTMKEVWLDDKLNGTVCQNVLELSKALKEKNIERADKIHIALMMQYANVCSSWIPGIRRIILELKTKCKDSADAEGQTECQDLLMSETNDIK